MCSTSAPAGVPSPGVRSATCFDSQRQWRHSRLGQLWFRGGEIDRQTMTGSRTSASRLLFLLLLLALPGKSRPERVRWSPIQSVSQSRNLVSFPSRLRTRPAYVSQVHVDRFSFYIRRRASTREAGSLAVTRQFVPRAAQLTPRQTSFDVGMIRYSFAQAMYKMHVR